MAQKGSSPYLKRHFNLFNKKYFGGKLPSNTIVRWAPTREMKDGAAKGENPMGWFIYGYKDKPSTILIHEDLKKLGWNNTAKETLLHEMTHLSFKWRDYHGKRFKMRIRELVARGAFDGLI